MADIRLPTTYYCADGTPDPVKYIEELVAFLSSPYPTSIVTSHPNEVAIYGPPKEWEEWWDLGWIDREEYDLDTVLKAIVANDASLVAQLPPTLHAFVQKIHSMTLPRDPDVEHAKSTYTGDRPPPPYMHTGMSLKKAHEIEQLSSLIGRLAGGGQIQHVADAGAGQGYLARALASRPLSLHVLALDSDGQQTHGAEKRATMKGQKVNLGDEGVETPPVDSSSASTLLHGTQSPIGTVTPDEIAAGRRGSISHSTIFIDSDTLPRALDDWIPFEPDTLPLPVLITGLHACGSLTPTVIRTVISMIKAKGDQQRGWYCGALAIVGCCYNRATSEGDFPFSRHLRAHLRSTNLEFESRHLQLAAQTPSIWPSDWNNARFGLRKVAMRALLGKHLHERGLSAVLDVKNVGRLNDKVFATWSEYFRKATAKLGVPLEWEGSDNLVEDQQRLVRRLEFFHVLRCMVGPVVESLILMDRWMKLREELPEEEWRVRMVNVFNQSTGSVRNVALVVSQR